jgi:hypothetical protein
LTGAVDNPTYAPLDLAEYNRQARLVRAQHCAYPVVFDGQQRFIQVIHSRLAGGRVEMEIYLTGDPQPIDSTKIFLSEAPQ